LFVSVFFLDIYDLTTEVLELDEDLTTNWLKLEKFEVCESAYSLRENVTIDEKLEAFRGR
jgi:hypothetical protein